MLRKTYKYRLYPNQKQIALLEHSFDICCELYNAAVQERRDAWQINRKSVSKYDQQNQLPELKKTARPDLKDVYAQVLCDVIQRVDKSFDGFFRRVKRGEKPGFPRFRSRRRYNSLTYPQHGFKLSDDGKRLELSKIGAVKIRLHRPIDGRIKTCSIVREATKWYVCFSCEAAAHPLPPTPAEIGINIGIRKFAVLSDGTSIDNPRFFETLQKKLAVAQRKLERQQRRDSRGRVIARSKRGEKTAAEIVRIHEKIRLCRNDFQHNVSKRLIEEYGTLAIEDLNVPSMTEEKWGKEIHDAAWSMFHDKLKYKAEFAERTLAEIPAWKREGVIDTTQKYLPRKTEAAKETLRRGKEMLSESSLK